MPEEVSTSGPFFDGRRDRIIKNFQENAEQAVAQQGENLVHQRLQGSIRVNRGVYESHIHTERQQDDLMVTDGGMVYGPWLEGTGSRNRTTRFKGYASFRLATQELDRQAAVIADKELQTAVAELNG